MTIAGAPVDGRGREDFAAWVSPHLSTLRRYAVRLHGLPDGEDLLQDALVRAWRRWETYNPDRGPAVAWLLTIVADQARARWRRERRRPVVTLGSPLPEGTVPVVPAVEVDVDLARALNRLAPRQRQAVDLYYYVGLDVATTAAVMACSPGTVQATLHQARARLREILGDAS